jgi:hypothetical protein
MEGDHMAQDLWRSTIGIFPERGGFCTGFVVADHLAVTTRHNVSGYQGQQIRIQFPDKGQQMAKVQYVLDNYDVAFLQLESLSHGVLPLVLGTARGCESHPCKVSGLSFEYFHEVHGVILGTMPNRPNHPVLQLRLDEIKAGMAGAPVLDVQSDLVIGMISTKRLDEGKEFAMAITSDTIATLNPQLLLRPERNEIVTQALDSQTVKRQRIKTTFYLQPEDIIAIDELQIKRFRERSKKPEKSELVSEAIQLLFSKQNG